jgi:hypothetical protein
MQQRDTIIAELEEAVRSGNAERRVHTLRQVTNLFLCDGERLSEDQIKVFDGVLCLLVATPAPSSAKISRISTTRPWR